MQTAVVVGPVGGGIYTDEFVRVKVQFHWDREGKKDEDSSCWIRVAQNWAGQNWGVLFNPRIGQEVVVSFLEGDPDQPLITGGVYNAEQMPPYPQPAEKTKSTIKSHSSKGGSADNFNEIRFEDRKGGEQLFIHAEKNQDIEVENDETHWVGHDRTVHVVGAFTETIDAGETRKVTAGVKESIIGGETRNITGNQDETISGKLDQKVTEGIKVTTPAMYELTANGGVKILSSGEVLRE